MSGRAGATGGGGQLAAALAVPPGAGVLGHLVPTLENRAAAGAPADETAAFTVETAQAVGLTNRNGK